MIRIKRILFWMRIWMWASVRHPDFKHFQFNLSPIIRVVVKFHHNRTTGEVLLFLFALHRPEIYHYVPWNVVIQFSYDTKTDIGFLDEDIPF